MQVQRQQTPASLAELADALVRSHVQVFGVLPSKRRATLLLAQWAIETGQGSAITNHNVGNLTATNESTQDFWRPPWFEPPPYASGNAAQLELLHKRMLEGKAPKAFRSYNDLEGGAVSYMGLLKSPHFTPLLKAADSGSARQFATQVYETDYCPDPECHPDKTTGSFTSLQKSITQKGLFDDLPSTGAEKLGLAVVFVPLGAWLAWKVIKNG